ncbi:MAG TPA: S8 family peptidase [Candidatus Binatia bacterium]|nr:S8 family peptidase [Candidatus Binatia bacterium]
MDHARFWIRVALAALLLALGFELAFAESPRRPLALEMSNGRAAVANEVIVRFKPNAARSARAEVERAEHIDLATPIGDGRALLLRSRSRSASTLVRNLARRHDVLYVEPNYVAQVQSVPDDPHFASLWAMQNIGQVVNNHPGLADADIDATLAWDVTTGSRSSVVAVIDSGIDYRHPDLAANVWSSPRDFTVTIGGSPITCPAGSHGFNAITRACDPMDDNNHGTHVSGTIGAVGNDGFGIVGVNWTAAIMGIKFIDAGGQGTTADAIDAIEFAIQARQVLGRDANVRVLSNSWILTGPSQALLDAILEADRNEMLFVVAAGNFGTDNDVTPLYPQSYATPNMISVAATSARDLLWGFSNVGPNTVHLGAPGVDVVSTTRNGGYAFQNGTSMAAPHVSGTAALMLAVDETLPVDELTVGILGGVDPLPDLQGLTVTGGRLNADHAVRSVVPRPGFRLDLASPAAQTAVAGTTATYAVDVTAVNGFTDAVRFDVTDLPDGAAASFTPDVVVGAGTTKLDVETSSTTPTGSHLLTITGTDGTRAQRMTVTTVVSASAMMVHLEHQAPVNLVLVEAPPTRTAARTRDSAGLARSKGNPWRPIGTWRTPPEVSLALADVGELQVWLGLRNSDDEGTSFDVKAELAVDGTVVASGAAICVSGLTRNPTRARAVTIDVAPEPGIDSFAGGLALTVAARLGTGDCPGHASARGVRLYYGAPSRDSKLGLVPGGQ